MTPPLDAYLAGLSDGDMFAPSEHELGRTFDGAPILTMAGVRAALHSFGLRHTVHNALDYMRGFGEHGRFLVAASKMGAVDYATGGVQ